MDVIGIDETFHDNSNIDAVLNGILKADHRRLNVTKEEEEDIIGIDETFDDNNDDDAEWNDKRSKITPLVFGQAETLSIGATSTWELMGTMVGLA